MTRVILSLAEVQMYLYRYIIIGSIIMIVLIGALVYIVEYLLNYYESILGLKPLGGNSHI